MTLRDAGSPSPSPLPPPSPRKEPQPTRLNSDKKSSKGGKKTTDGGSKTSKGGKKTSDGGNNKRAKFANPHEWVDESTFILYAQSFVTNASLSAAPSAASGYAAFLIDNPTIAALSFGSGAVASASSAVEDESLESVGLEPIVPGTVASESAPGGSSSVVPAGLDLQGSAPELHPGERAFRCLGCAQMGARCMFTKLRKGAPLLKCDRCSDKRRPCELPPYDPVLQTKGPRWELARALKNRTEALNKDRRLSKAKAEAEAAAAVEAQDDVAPAADSEDDVSMETGSEAGPAEADAIYYGFIEQMAAARTRAAVEEAIAARRSGDRVRRPRREGHSGNGGKRNGRTPLSKEAERQREREAFRKRQKAGLARLDGQNTDEQADDHDEDDQRWTGTHLHDLMTSPRKARSLAAAAQVDELDEETASDSDDDLDIQHEARLRDSASWLQGFQVHHRILPAQRVEIEQGDQMRSIMTSWTLSCPGALDVRSRMLPLGGAMVVVAVAAARTRHRRIGRSGNGGIKATKKQKEQK
ncbi:hypothetical protein PENARI_c004G10134 [Penicillium arizonense]|uniref:Uncharacterized protein n=1 Tax=Penicillium arizonense TaxID=1835702 RepID=A0A1F5LQA3_PENAI|nr:hypothetical protein PENARI_c004G10134 [Penicillium arizonense]OGE55378.1 hypothetical protein PENARI_c004G10134 [Penicillium arizonense]